MVLCDRFSASTVAYQQYGRRLDAALVDRAIELAIGGLEPDLNVLLDLPPESGLGRAGAPSDRFEREGLAFHQRVHEGFLAQAIANPRTGSSSMPRAPRRRSPATPSRPSAASSKSRASRDGRGARRDSVRLLEERARRLEGGLARIEHANPVQRRIDRVRHQHVEGGVVVPRVDWLGGDRARRRLVRTAPRTPRD